jgi:peptidoglycan hydrolase-like protein with peptidoglycan-binding domain
MRIAGKFGWACVAFTILTTATFVQGFPRGAAGSDSNKEEVAGFVVKNEIRKIQEILRSGGNYQGKIDGVFGLRTRASIRAYQKAENLPVTGQVDARTAAGLVVRPESSWINAQRAGRRDVGHSSDIVVGEIKRDKPSAGIRRAEGSANKTSRNEVSRATATQDNRGGGADKRQVENQEHDQ